MNRQEEQALVSQMTKYERKMYFKAKKDRRDKRRALIGKLCGCFIGIFMVFIVGFSVYRSFQPVYTIGTEKLSKEEYNFYHTLFTNDYISNNYYYLSYFGLDLNKSLESQVYNEETGETWADFFYKKTDSQLQEIFSLKIDADKNNHVYENLEEDVELFISEIKEAAETQSMTYNAYIKSLFGNNMTEKKLNSYVTEYLYAINYGETVFDSFSATDAEVNSKYDANKQNYDYVDYNCYSMDIEENEDGTTNEELVVINMDILLTKINSGSTFVDAVNESIPEDNTNKKNYEDGTAVTFNKIAYSDINTVLSNWLYDENRKQGDIEIIKNDNLSCYYLIQFNDRYLDKSNTVDVRHILASFEYDENNNLIESSKTAAKEKIDKIKADYEANPTLENFEKLCKENSDDSTATNGGLIEGIYKGAMVEEFEEWCFDETRKEKETGIIETDYGYHLMYYEGENEPAYILSIKNTIISEKYESWLDGIIINYVSNR